MEGEDEVVGCGGRGRGLRGALWWRRNQVVVA